MTARSLSNKVFANLQKHRVEEINSEIIASQCFIVIHNH